MSEWDQPEYQTLTLSWTRSQTCQQVLWHVQSLGEAKWRDRDRPRHQPEADYLELESSVGGIWPRSWIDGGKDNK